MFKDIINGIAKKTEETNPNQQSDYIGEDGLLYCGLCHTKKQCKVNIFGREDIVYCKCKCYMEAREAERAAELKAEKARHIQKLRHLGFPDQEMQKWTFDVDDGKNAEMTQLAKNYVKAFDEWKKQGKGLLFFGSVGTGKTFISACIANALIDKGYSCLVTNFARLVNTIQGMFDGKQEYIDSLNRFDLLVIDDLASERNTEYMNEIVFNIIDSRYRSGLPLIITTNLTGEELKKPAEISKQRIYSRLFEMCLPIEVAGDDRRKQKLREDYDRMKSLLEMNAAERNEEE